MNKVVVKQNQVKEIYLNSKENVELTYDVYENAKLIVYQYGVNIGGKICVNLQGDGAEVEYHYSVINYDDNRLDVVVNHNACNTISNVYNHGINVNNKRLVFDVTGKVLKSSDACIVNQENQIINLQDGDSSILPNLLIDNYDVASSHAAYIGKFKEDLIYYLMSRGISRKKSIELLIKSLLLNGGDINNDEVKEFLKNIEEV